MAPKPCALHWATANGGDPHHSFFWGGTYYTVRAEMITELILKRAGPVIFKTFLLELIAFRPIPVICTARGVKPENFWKR